MSRLNILLSIIFCVAVLSCKKKTSVSVRVFNPALNENVANAEVVLIEKKGESGGGIFSGQAQCTEIARAVSDANGICYFDEEKLRSNGKYTYFCSVAKSWGKDQYYTCGGRTSGFLEKGKNQEIIVTDEADGYLQVKYTNLLNPSQLGDSLIISLITIDYINPKGGITEGGGAVFGDFQYYNINNPPNHPAEIFPPVIKTKGQRLKRSIRKRKMGLVTTSVDTIKVYPNQTTIVEFNW